MLGRMVVIAFGAGLLFAAPALAASQQDRDACQSRDPAAAIAGCSSIIGDAAETPQGRADAYVFRAGAYVAQGNLDRAIADYGEALKLSPRDFAAYVGRALAEFKKGQKDAAILDYSIADKLNAGAVALIVPGNADLRQIADAARASPPPANALALVDQLPQTVAPPSPAPSPPPAPPPPSPPPQSEAPAAAPPAPKMWNSIAASIWRVHGRVHVAVGYSGLRQTEADARQSALDACRNGGGRTCESKGAWNFGCVYITTGSTRSRAGWASGNSEDAAVSKCRDDGLSCKKPIGGCVE
jgi:tetratricopeptide (TPR) repeat protein